MNQDELNKELKKHLSEGESASDILKKIKESKQKQKQPTGGIPTPPPPPKKPLWDTTPTEQEQPQPTDQDLNKLEKLKEENKDLKRDVNFWSTTAGNYLKNLQLLTAQNVNLEEENKELKKKLTISPLRPKAKSMPVITERDKLIIQQASGHLEHLTNAKVLRERILKAEQEGTKEAYWELQKDLREPGEIQQKLLQFFQQDSDQVISFNYTLAAILRGEYLDEIK